jgi:hypothetical protein
MACARAPLFAAIACAAMAGAQRAPWLREVARIATPDDDVVAAALSSDGAMLATADHNGSIRLLAVRDWRELRRLALPQPSHPLDVAFTGDGSIVMVRVAEDQHHALRIADGAVVVVPWAAAAHGVPPAEMLATFADATDCRPAGTSGAMLFRTDGQLGLWHAGAVRWLGSGGEAMLTGNGEHVVIAGRGVEARAVGGGEPWTVPALGTHAIAAPFGRGAELVAADRRVLVTFDAARRAVTRRLELASLGIAPAAPRIVAARADGELAVLVDAGAGRAWLVDVARGTARELPDVPAAVAWVGDGLLLVTGQHGPCTVAADRWLWLADPATATPPAPWTAPPFVVEPQPLLVVNAAGEVVLSFVRGEHRSFVGRFRASDGVQLERRTQGELATGSHIVVAHDLVLGLRNDVEDALQLRQATDLALLGEGSWPWTTDAPPSLRAATHARRVLVQRRGEIVVFDLRPELAFR